MASLLYCVGRIASRAKVRAVMSPLFENETHIVLIFSSARPVDRENLNKPIKHSRPHAAYGPFKIGSDMRAVVRMAFFQPELKLSYCFRITERFSRLCRMCPSQREAVVRRSKSASQDIVEGIEISAPSRVQRNILKLFKKR